MVSSPVWRPARWPVGSFSNNALLARISRRSRRAGGADRVSAQHEPHRFGNGQHASAGNGAGICRGWLRCVGSWIAAHYISWQMPRLLQHAQKAISLPIRLATLNRLAPENRYTKEQISPYFWSNGKLPEREGLETAGARGFRRLQAENRRPGRESCRAVLAGNRALNLEEQITMHHCIQGWSGIAQWSGVPMKTLVDLVKPKPAAKTVAFFVRTGSSMAIPTTTRKAWKTF